MPSTRDKRAAARARLEQRMAEKAATARKRRKVKVAVASAIAAVLVVGLGTFITVKIVSGLGMTTCDYATAQNANGSANPNVLATGKPESKAPAEGTEDFTLQLNTGDVVVQMDLDKAPCTANSFAFLSSKNYFTNTQCHRVTTEGLYVLQCGDPNGDGSGGPSYAVKDENLPTKDASGYGSYPAGTVAMAEASNGDPGSQFFIVYQDTELPANYTRVGFVQTGLDVVKAIAAKGAVSKETGEAATDGSPKDPVTIVGTSMSEPDPDATPHNPWTQPMPPSPSSSESAKPEDEPSPSDG